MAKGLRVTTVTCPMVEVEQGPDSRAVIVLTDHTSKKQVKGELSLWQIATLGRALNAHLDRTQNTLNHARKALRNEQ